MWCEAIPSPALSDAFLKVPFDEVAGDIIDEMIQLD